MRVLPVLSLLLSPTVGLLHSYRPALAGRRTTATVKMTGSAQLEVVAKLKSDLDALRALRPTKQSRRVQLKLWEAAGLNPMYKVSGSFTGEPSFTQLFSHETWTKYTGKSPFQRWLRALVTWRYSTILASVWPVCLCASCWAFAVTSIPVGYLPRMSPVPLTLMGSAIGLLLVFRVNNLYSRARHVIPTHLALSLPLSLPRPRSLTPTHSLTHAYYSVARGFRCSADYLGKRIDSCPRGFPIE